tara:strand:+ start:12421 stop:12693 length:273 start_codon:yes stop_codon:yes gene_type:complete
MPFVNKDTKSRRKLIFSLFDEGKSTDDINKGLREASQKELDNNEAIVWKQFLHPIAKKDVTMYDSIVIEGKGLSWIARSSKSRCKNQIIS